MQEKGDNFKNHVLNEERGGGRGAQWRGRPYAHMQFCGGRETGRARGHRCLKMNRRGGQRSRKVSSDGCRLWLLHLPHSLFPLPLTSISSQAQLLESPSFLINDSSSLSSLLFQHLVIFSLDSQCSLLSGLFIETCFKFTFHLLPERTS